MILNAVKAAFYLVSLVLLTPPCFALPEDQNQIMQLHADSAELDQQSHRGVYIGNVQLDQGSTHIRAADAITEGNEKNQLIKATIKGNREAQAHYWTLTANNKPLMHAYADTIYYYPEQHSIELLGNARVEQGEDSFSAQNIRYDTLDHRVISKNNATNQTIIIMHQGKKA